MMGVCVVDQLLNAPMDAIHFCFRRPHECRHGQVGLQRVHFRVFGHFQPVDAPDEFPPAQYLPDEALHRIDRGSFVSVGLNRRVDHLTGVEQVQIEDTGQAGMI